MKIVTYQKQRTLPLDQFLNIFALSLRLLIFHLLVGELKPNKEAGAVLFCFALSFKVIFTKEKFCYCNRSVDLKEITEKFNSLVLTSFFDHAMDFKNPVFLT